jgi:hypothetical protein
VDDRHPVQAATTARGLLRARGSSGGGGEEHQRCGAAGCHRHVRRTSHRLLQRGRASSRPSLSPRPPPPKLRSEATVARDGQQHGSTSASYAPPSSSIYTDTQSTGGGSVRLYSSKSRQLPGRGKRSPRVGYEVPVRYSMFGLYQGETQLGWSLLNILQCIQLIGFRDVPGAPALA